MNKIFKIIDVVLLIISIGIFIFMIYTSFSSVIWNINYFIENWHTCEYWVWSCNIFRVYWSSAILLWSLWFLYRIFKWYSNLWKFVNLINFLFFGEFFLSAMYIWDKLIEPFISKKYYADIYYDKIEWIQFLFWFVAANLIHYFIVKIYLKFFNQTFNEINLKTNE